MSPKKLAMIVVPIVLFILAFVFLPKYFENRIVENFDPTKVEELKSRNLDQYNELIENFNKAKDLIRKSPGDVGAPGAWTTIGIIADTFGDERLAETAYKKVIELEPKVFLARSNLAVLYVRQEKYRDAEALYLEILKNNKRDIQTYENLARLYASGKVGSVAAAKAILEQGIRETGDETLKQLLEKLNQSEAL